jgi:hypothetical protein
MCERIAASAVDTGLDGRYSRISAALPNGNSFDTTRHEVASVVCATIAIVKTIGPKRSGSRGTHFVHATEFFDAAGVRCASARFPECPNGLARCVGHAGPRDTARSRFAFRLEVPRDGAALAGFLER